MVKGEKDEKCDCERMKKKTKITRAFTIEF
jgi:hypothetical protein